MWKRSFCRDMIKDLEMGTLSYIIWMSPTHNHKYLGRLSWHSRNPKRAKGKLHEEEKKVLWLRLETCSQRIMVRKRMLGLQSARSFRRAFGRSTTLLVFSPKILVFRCSLQNCDRKKSVGFCDPEDGSQASYILGKCSNAEPHLQPKSLLF